MGFDFLGYRISPQGLSMTKRSFDLMTVQLHRLFEQVRGDQPRLVQYQQYWIRWVTTGVSLNVKSLILKTTAIFQHTLHVHLT